MREYDLVCISVCVQRRVTDICDEGDGRSKLFKGKEKLSQRAGPFIRTS